MLLPSRLPTLSVDLTKVGCICHGIRVCTHQFHTNLIATKDTSSSRLLAAPSSSTITFLDSLTSGDFYLALDFILNFVYLQNLCMYYVAIRLMDYCENVIVLPQPVYELF